MGQPHRGALEVGIPPLGPLQGGHQNREKRPPLFGQPVPAGSIDENAFGAEHRQSVCDGAGWEYHGAQVVRALIGALDLDRDTQMAYGMMSRGTKNVWMITTT